MAGRKRKPGRREPNGRPQREGVIEVIGDTLYRRCRVMGWPKSDWQRARDPRLSTLHGRLFLAEMIRETEYLAIQKYADIHAAYLRAIGAPKPWPKVLSIDAGGCWAGSELSDGAARAISDEFMAAEGALLASGHKASVVEVLGANESIKPSSVHGSSIAALKQAAKTLAGHFKIY